MMRCPQCAVVYHDDYVFCLTDGNALVDDGTEQETVVNRKFQVPAAGVEVETAIYCACCGLENKAHSKFCKKCGQLVDASQVPVSPMGAFSQFGGAPPEGNMHPNASSFAAPSDRQAYGETVTFQPPTFPSGQRPGVASPTSNKTVLMLVGAVAAVLLLGVIYLVTSGKPSSTDAGKNQSGNPANTSSTLSMNPPARLPETFDNFYEGTVDGRREIVPLTLHLKRDKAVITGTAETAAAVDELWGTIDADGTFQANGTPRGKPMSGIWKGQISLDGTITGSWTSLNGRASSPFSVTERKP